MVGINDPRGEFGKTLSLLLRPVLGCDQLLLQDLGLKVVDPISSSLHLVRGRLVNRQVIALLSPLLPQLLDSPDLLSFIR